MKLAMIGAGYVGLTTAALFADRGNNVICVDNNKEVVGKLRKGDIHFFEPGLSNIVQKAVNMKNLRFTTEIRDAVQEADVSFIAVGTPSNDDGSFNLNYFFNAAIDIGNALRGAKGFKVVVGKSTVPQRTHEKVTQLISEFSNGVDWAYVSNPETLAEGTAVSDFSKPDRVLIGTDSDKAYEVMAQLYHPFVRRQGQIMRSSPASAELAKLSANTVLASRIAVINELARVADVTPGADMEDVRRLVGSDARIGYHFIFPGPGYGGSCFPKDVQGLVDQSRADGYDPTLLSRIHDSNESHKEYMGERVIKLLKAKGNPVIGVWGLTFKPGTDDMRDAASIPILTRFINEGAIVNAYDPQDIKARGIFGDRINIVGDRYAAAKGADALVLLTEWGEFDAPDFEQLRGTMPGRQLFDLRNRWQPSVVNREGFDYFGVGRNYPLD